MIFGRFFRNGFINEVPTEIDGVEVNSTNTAGFIGQQICCFSEDGSRITTLWPTERESVLGLSDGIDLIPGSCPFFGICGECPERVLKSHEQVEVSGEVLVRSAQVDDAISSVRQF